MFRRNIRQIFKVIFHTTISKYLLLFLFCICVNLSSAQNPEDNSYYLECQIIDQPKLLKNFPYTKIHQDSVSAIHTSQQLLATMQKVGYFEALLENVEVREKRVVASFRVGTPYFWKKLDKGNLDKSMLRHIHFKKKKFTNQAFDYEKWENLQDKILTYAENNGYPFASVQLDSMIWSKNQLEAQILYEAGKLFFLDTIHVVGKLKVKQKFLQNYLKLNTGDVFSQAKVARAEKLLKQLPFLKVVRKPSVSFKSLSSKTHVAYPDLYLNPKKASQIDLIVGFLPNEERENQVLVTGNVDITLRNLFRSGVDFSGQWQRLRTETQLLKMNYVQRTLGKTNFAFETSLDFLKQDTSFTRITFPKLDLKYRLPNTAEFSVGLHFFRTRILDSTLYNNEFLPEVLDLNFNAYTVGYVWNNLDDYFTPRKGNRFALNLMIGNKNIIQNQNIPDSLYRDVSLQSTQIQATGYYEQHFKTGKQTSLMTRIRLGMLLNDNLFENELFQLGGLQTLRGHNENTFFASNYGILTAEYRLFFEEESYIFAFYEQGFLQKQVLDTFEQDTPLGTGFGLSFKTRAGIFNFVYALGRSAEQTLSFNRSKIHFGLVSRF